MQKSAPNFERLAIGCSANFHSSYFLHLSIIIYNIPLYIPTTLISSHYCFPLSLIYTEMEPHPAFIHLTVHNPPGPPPPVTSSKSFRIYLSLYTIVLTCSLIPFLKINSIKFSPNKLLSLLESISNLKP